MSYLIYYLVNGEYVEKYKINIDEEELKKIKLESIYKCGKEDSQKKHLSTAEFKAKKIIEQAEAIREENQGTPPNAKPTSAF